MATFQLIRIAGLVTCLSAAGLAHGNDLDSINANGAATIVVGAKIELPRIGLPAFHGRGRSLYFKNGEQVEVSEISTSDTYCQFLVSDFTEQVREASLLEQSLPAIEIPAGAKGRISRYAISLTVESPNSSEVDVRYFAAEANVNALANGEPAVLKHVRCFGKNLTWSSLARVTGGQFLTYVEQD